MEQNPEPRDWLAKYSKGHGVTLHDVDDESLAPRLTGMFIMLVHSHFEEFLRNFLKSNPDCRSWKERGDASLFEYVVKNLGLASSGNGANERETIEYYHLARNILAHPDIKKTRLNNQRTKLRSLLNVKDEYLPPAPLERFGFGDFFMFTRAVKAFAAIICEKGRPSDGNIARMIAPEIKCLNRFKANPKRFRNSVRQYLLMNYQLGPSESDSIIDVLAGR